MNRKVTVVGGAGNVGATVARSIAEKELADVVIVDTRRPESMRRRARYSRDLPDYQFQTRCSSVERLCSEREFDVVIIHVWRAEKPGMIVTTLSINFNIMKAVTEQVVKLAELHHCSMPTRSMPCARRC